MASATGPDLSSSGDAANEPRLLERVIAPEIADVFLRTLWSDIRSQKVDFQTHQQGLLRKNALEVHGRHSPAMMGLHWGLTSRVAEEVGRQLVPSFAFFRMYFRDDVCRVHSDRPACEVSLSVTIGYSDGKPWDLSIGTASDFDTLAIADDFGEEPFRSYAMRPGDGLLYHGSRRRHGRLVPNPNCWSAHLFLQWVDPSGPHRSEAFERLEFGSIPQP